MKTKLITIALIGILAAALPAERNLGGRDADGVLCATAAEFEHGQARDIADGVEL